MASEEAKLREALRIARELAAKRLAESRAAVEREEAAVAARRAAERRK